ncbi:hypothetical protein [Streptomyces sp. NPDC015350]|uniref:hypothetical protein n=1 Tax=Streptomyces sp. NPDC015350 TaxID=3364955 RepID=UPI0037025CCE
MDIDLEEAIATTAGLPASRVRAVLGQLRECADEPGWRTVVRGWACGAITTQDQVALPARTGLLTGPGAPSAPLQPPAVPPPDSLRLVPVTQSWSAQGSLGSDGTLAGAVIVTGRDCGLVRVHPAICRQVLDGTPVGRWGPVLGCPASQTALLLTPPRALAAPWRAPHGRLWRPGARVCLPPEYRTGPDGTYWAVSCRAPLWPAAHLQQLLESSLFPTTVSENTR